MQSPQGNDGAEKQSLEAVAKMARFRDAYSNPAARLGIQNDNVLSDSYYVLNLLTRNRIQLEAGYRGSWVIGVIIDSVADDMTRAGITMTTSEGAKNIEDLKSALSRFQIFNSINGLIKWGRLYGGALGVLMIKGQDLSTPLRVESIGQGQFQGIAVYDRWQIQPDLTNSIHEGPEIGLPASYKIVGINSTGGNMYAGVQLGQTIHHSRVIRYEGIQLPYYQAITEEMWGESVVERLHDRLVSFDATTMSAANLVSKAQLRTISIEGLREIISAGGPARDGLYAHVEMMRMFQVNEGITMLDTKDVFSSEQYSFSGLADILLQFGQQLSGATGIPLVRMFGQSPAGLSATGESDIRMYYDNINAQQNSRLRGGMELILKCLYASLFGKPLPKDFQFTFTPLWQMSDTDKALVAESTARTVISAFEAGIISKAAALKELRQASAVTGLFTNITDEDISDAEDEPPMPVMGQPLDPNANPSGEDDTASTPETPADEKGAGEVEQVEDADSAMGRIKKWLAQFKRSN